MASFTLTYPYLSIASNDLSSYVREITLDAVIETPDNTASSSGGWKTEVGGLKGATLQVKFNQDVAAAAIDSIMWPLFIAGASVTFEVRATGAAVGASNPKWTGSLVINSWQPVAGSVGDVAEVTGTYMVTSTVTRATA